MWSEAICAAGDIPSLLNALNVNPDGLMHEVIDLNNWVKPLNVMDSALEAVLRAHPSLVLLWDKGGPPPERPVPADSKRITSAIIMVGTPMRIFF